MEKNRERKYQKSEKKHFCSKVILLLLIIPFFRPDFISEMSDSSWINIIFVIWRMTAFFFILGKYGIDFLKNPELDRNFIVIVIYEIILLYSSIYNQEMIKERLIDIANFLGIYFIYISYGKQQPKLFIKVNFQFFSFLVWTNAVLTVIFPHGLNRAVDNSARVNFLGKDNTITLIFILTIVFCALYHNIFPRNPAPFLTTVVICTLQFYYMSGSGIVVTVVLILYLCFVSDWNWINRLLNGNLMFMIYMILEVMIVFLNHIEFLNPLFFWLNKASTFTDRRYYWDTAIYQFLDSPFWGQGNGITYLWNNNYYSHNSFLDILLKGGIAGTVLWCVMVLYLINRVKLKKNLRVKGFIVCCFFCFLLTGLMEGLEDRIAFNAFLSVLPVLNRMEETEMLRNKLINSGIQIKKHAKPVIKYSK